jgi:hypothetical protein
MRYSVRDGLWLMLTVALLSTIAFQKYELEKRTWSMFEDIAALRQELNRDVRTPQTEGRQRPHRRTREAGG